MASDIQEQSVMSEPETGHRRTVPDASALQDQTPMWARTTRSSCLSTLLLGLVYLWFSVQPLYHSDLWAHLAYGQWIIEHGALPATEPLMPLAEGVPFVDLNWLSQVIGVTAWSVAQHHGIQFLYGMAIALSVACVAASVRHRTRGRFWPACGGLIFLAINHEQLIIVRPQLAGVLCFCALLAVVTRREWRHSNWVVVPLLFVLWTGLHGSFGAGLVLLTIMMLGRSADVARRTGRWTAPLADTQVRRYLLLLQLSSVAVLLNPYGVRVYIEALNVSGNTNVQDLRDWQPLTLRMFQGKVAGLATVALLAAWWRTPRRITTAEVLVVLITGTAAMWSSRMINWYAPVAAWSLAIHGAAIYRHHRPATVPPQQEPRGLWTLVNLGLVWIVFALSPAGSAVLHDRYRDLDKAVSRRTPVAAVSYLNTQPASRGLIFAPNTWGDYLLWSGAGTPRVYATSHVHLLPGEVWNHYMQVTTARDGWDRLLDRYGVDTVLMDHDRHGALVYRLREHEDWIVGYEDARSIVFHRQTTGPDR